MRLRIVPILPFILLVASRTVSAQTGPQSSVQQEFISGGTIRMELEAGGYTIRPGDSANIVVTCHANSEDQLKNLRVDIRAGTSTADVLVRDTPHNNFSAIIEVPRQSHLWVRLSAGELDVQGVEGNKDLGIRAGQLQVEVPYPEQYRRSDASVLAGSIEAPAFHVSKGGLFRSFRQQGPGKYRLHAQVLAGEIDLRTRIPGE